MRARLAAPTAAAVAMLLSVAGCVDELAMSEPVAVSIAPAAAPPTLAVRDTYELRVAVTDAARRSLVPPRLEWSTSDPQVVRVEPLAAAESDPISVRLTARVIAVGRGTAAVTVRVSESPALVPKDTSIGFTVRERWLELSAGFGATCALSADSTAYCWGVVGPGDFDERVLPKLAFVFSSEGKFRSVSVGGNSACGVTARLAIVLCWGGNDAGQLGDGTMRDHTLPSTTSTGISARQVSMGDSQVCAIIRDLTTLCWGVNAFKIMANGPNGGPGTLCFSDHYHCYTAPTHDLPVYRYPANGGRDVSRFTSISLGARQACGLEADGIAYCWGDGSVGATGATAWSSCFLQGSNSLTATIACDPVADSVRGAPKFVSITSGSSHSCALTSVGDVWCWGQNDAGQLGFPTTTTCNWYPYAPTNLSSFVSASCGRRATKVVTALKFESVVAGREFTCGIEATTHRGYCWGLNDNSQLGSATTQQCVVFANGSKSPLACSTSPRPIAGDLAFSRIAVGDYHACGITRPDGALYCWGSGYLGDGASHKRTEPGRIAEP